MSIPEHVFAHAKATLAQGPGLVSDLQPGFYFDDPAYFDSLPRQTQELI